MTFYTNTDKQVLAVNQRLRKLGETGIPQAAAGTLNNMAFESRKRSIKEFELDHVIRSNWTQRGMLFDKTRTTIPIKQMESRSGNTRDYAKILELGGALNPNKEYLSIPGMAARVGKNKRKRVAKRYKIDNLKALRRLPSVKGDAKQKFAAMLNMGRKEKYFGPFLVSSDDDPDGTIPHGIFNLIGQGKGKRGGGTIAMLRKLKTSARINSHPFISNAGLYVGRNMDKTYIKQAVRILRKYDKDIR